MCIVLSFTCGVHAEPSALQGLEDRRPDTGAAGLDTGSPGSLDGEEDADGGAYVCVQPHVSVNVLSICGRHDQCTNREQIPATLCSSFVTRACVAGWVCCDTCV